MADMTLEEALAAATVDEELVSPVNEVLMINPETRTINVPDSEKLFGARQDMGVERKHFKCPRIVGDNIDLSQHRIFVNYVPSKQDGTYNLEDDVQGYWCKDLAVEGDFITFSWEISENVTRSAGYIAFAVYAKTIDEYGNLKTKWHTTIAIGNVLDTLPDGEEWVTVYPDIVMQLLERMDEVEKIATEEAMQGYVDDYFNRNPMMIDRELKDETKAAPADIVGKLSEDIVTKASAIKETASGEVIVVTDSDEAKPLGLAIDGKSEQKQYSGKNLVENTQKSGIYRGVTFVINEDGTAIFNGTATEKFELSFNDNVYLESGKYVLNGCPSGGSNSTYRLACYFLDESGLFYVDTGSSVTFEITSPVSMRVYAIVNASVTVSNLVFKPMIRLASVEDDTYEPYCGGIPSPNPSYPQEIRNIGVYDEASGKYAVEVKHTGKNLLDINNPYLKETLFSKEGVPNTNKNFDSFRFRIKKSDTLVVKATRTESSVNLRGLLFDLNMKFLTYIFSELEPGETKREYTATEDGYLIICNRKENTNVAVYYSHITDDTYEPYKETTATVYLDEPLRKGDKAYWNGGSKVRIDRNTISYKPIVSKVTEITDSDGNPAYRLTCRITHLAGIKSVLSNCFIQSTSWTQVNGIGLSGSLDSIYIQIPKEELTDESVETAQNWINSHDVVAEYQLAEPITEEIDLSLDGLSIFYPTTILSNDCNANMEVEYIADTKAYIDKKFAELATAML